MAEDTPQDPPVQDPPADEVDEPLREPGKKALDEERRARRDLEQRLKELEPLAAKAREQEEASKTETQKERERAEAAEKVASTATSEALRLRVALAKAPEGATREQILSAAKRLVGSNEEELSADADDLFSTLTLPSTPAPPRRGAVDQGQRGDGKPLQLTRADLAGMTPQQIVAAKKEGRLDAALNPSR